MSQFPFIRHWVTKPLLCNFLQGLACTGPDISLQTAVDGSSVEEHPFLQIRFPLSLPMPGPRIWFLVEGHSRGDTMAYGMFAQSAIPDREAIKHRWQLGQKDVLHSKIASADVAEGSEGWVRSN